MLVTNYTLRLGCLLPDQPMFSVTDQSFTTLSKGMRVLLLLLFISIHGFSQDISVYNNRIIADSVYFGIKNNVYAPLELSLKPKEAYVDAVRGTDFVLLRPKDSVAVFGVVPLEIVADTSSIKYFEYFDFEGTWGDSKTAKHDDTYRYLLPYGKGKRIKIVQSWGGKFSHSSVRSRYAIDFGTQVGDTIYAAREGIVVKTKSDSKERGGRDMIDKANEVRILHPDGTLASYVHLDYGGVFVEPGDQVSRGQAIGISGFTGFTTTPHLHFVVREAKNVSVPIYFEGLPEKKLKPGKRYKH